MKNFLISILTIAGITFTESYAFAQDFLISMEDTSCDYSRSNPIQFSNGSKGFLVVWSDTRNGPSESYAQRFDSLSRPEGTNFPIYSNSGIAFSPNGSFLVEKDNYSSWGNSQVQIEWYSLLASMCSSDGTWSPPFVLHGPATLAFDCVGICIGLTHEIAFSDSRYVSALNSGGTLTILTRDWNGNTLWTRSNIYQGGAADTIHVADYSMCLNQKEELAVVWVNVPYWNPLSDTTHQVMGMFLDSAGDTIAANVVLRSDPTEESNLDWWRNEIVKILPLPNNRYEVFDYDADSFTLHYWTTDTAGRRVGGINALEVYHDADSSHIYLQHTKNFGFTPIVHGKFSLLLTVSEYISSHDRYYNSLLTFGSDGRLVDGPITDTTAVLSAGKDFFRLPDSTLVIPALKDNDVYLVKCRGLTPIGMTKVNDNSRGSNDVLTGARSSGTNGFIVTWKDSKNSFGRLIGNDGLPLGAPVEPAPPAPDTLANGNSISLWNKADGDSMYALGYTIYDRSHVPILTDTLAHNSAAGWLFGLTYSFPDSSFVVFYADGTVLNLRHVETDGEYREVTVAAQFEGYWSLKILPESDSTSWIGYNYNIRRVSESLD